MVKVGHAGIANSGFPPEYYNFLNTGTTEPDWNALYPREWEAAKRHALLLELGKPATTRLLNSRIDEIRAEYGNNTILIGGPPCQAYSLVGRARNRGVDGYVAENDPKHFLYEQYIHILERLQPAVFIMENVTGMLSSSVNKKGIFARVLADLRSAGTSGDYRLISLAPPDDERLKFPDAEPRPKDFILCAEEFGLPQSRHRVIVTGLRNDLSSLSREQLADCILKRSPQKAKIENVLDGMARLRSGLSHDDSPGLWAEKIKNEVKTVSSAFNAFPPADRRLLKERLEECAMTLQNESRLLPRSASRPNRVGIPTDEQANASCQRPRRQAIGLLLPPNLLLCCNLRPRLVTKHSLLLFFRAVHFDPFGRPTALHCGRRRVRL
jgi:DNA (cytosine-5)-methyltransferase 1